MRRSGIPESLIDKHLDGIMAGETPGIAQERKYGTLITQNEIHAAGAAENGVAKASAASKGLLNAEEKLAGSTKAELELLKKTGGSVKGTLSTVGIAIIMIEVSALDAFGSSEGAKRWYNDTCDTLYDLAAGEVVSIQRVENIKRGTVFDKALWQLTGKMAEAGGLGASALGAGANQGFSAMAGSIYDTASTANSAHIAANKK